VVGVARDVTQQKRSEEALRTVESNLQAIFHVNVSEQQQFLETLQHSEEKFEKLFRASPVAMWITAVLKRRLLDANDALLRLLGYPRKEVIGKKILDLHLWADTQAQARVHETILAGESVEPFEARWRKKDGETIALILSAVPILQEGELCLLGIAVDISERMRSAEEREQLLEQVKAGRERLQRLASQLITAQEEERRRISREVHDEAGQALSALTISLNLIRAELPARQKGLYNRVGDAIQLTQKTLEGLRFLAQDLRPPGLDTLGLNATLQGYCEEISRRTKMPINYRGSLSVILPETHLISLYRFLQETLTNALKHSRAKHIRVRLSHDEDVVTLEVRDDGAGIPEALRQDILSRRAPESGSSQGGIGLVGLQERFGLIGGMIEIESRPGDGSSFIARLPIHTPYLERRASHDPRRDS
jgi:two-component system sensor histidine kinase UhpB